MFRLAFLLTILILAACKSTPSVTENQCRAGDWQTIGYRDGAAGLSSTNLLAHQEACGVFEIVPERGSYLAGWSNGLGSYCTSDNGFYLGQRGASFNRICNSMLQEPFSSAYKDGRALYLARTEVNQLISQIRNREARLDRIKPEMVSVAAAQLVPNLPPEDRINLLAELESLADEQGRIKSELQQLDRDLAAAEFELDALSQTLVSAGY